MRGKSQQTSSTQSLVSLGQSNLHEFYIGSCILMWLLATALIVRIGDFLIMEFAEEFNDSNFWLAVLVGRDCWLIRWCWMCNGLLLQRQCDSKPWKRLMIQRMKCESKLSAAFGCLSILWKQYWDIAIDRSTIPTLRVEYWFIFCSKL